MGRDDLCDMKTDTPPNSPATIDGMMQRADEFARREPLRASMSAFGAGFLLNLLPLSTIASALVGIAFSFLRPVLLFLGLYKACELCRCKTQTDPKP